MAHGQGEEAAERHAGRGIFDGINRIYKIRGRFGRNDGINGMGKAGDILDWIKRINGIREMPIDMGWGGDKMKIAIRWHFYVR